MQSDIFLVRFSDRYFFIERQDSKPIGTMIPSLATFLSYECAIQIIKALRSLGYDDAVVCTSRGHVAMPEDLCIHDDVCHEEFQAAWGDDETETVSVQNENETMAQQ
jgi:hypothetical protein